MNETKDGIRPVLALKMARACLGWSQEELAIHLGISKTVLARFETLEGGLTSEQLTKLLRVYHKMGVIIDFITSDEVRVSVRETALDYAFDRLKDVSRKRSDRRTPRGLLDYVAPEAAPDLEVDPNKIKGLL